MEYGMLDDSLNLGQFGNGEGVDGDVVGDSVFKDGFVVGEVMLEGEVLAGGFLENFFGYERWWRCIGKDMDFLIVGGFAKENATLLVQCRE